MKYHLVKYTGPFAFIKPWTAVRDSEVLSQQFLTPSMIMGIERKLFPELYTQSPIVHRIKGHRLCFESMSPQQEMVQPKGWNNTRLNGKKAYRRPYSILTRNVLINPVLILAFEKKEYAQAAATQHVCCSRNEDILFPVELMEVSRNVFQKDESIFPGFELVFEQTEDSFLVGYNRFANAKPMYGWLKIVKESILSVNV